MKIICMKVKMTHYIMEKSAWDNARGEYSIITKTPSLTLSQMKAKVARIPKTTDWLWSITMIDTRTEEVLGSISADEFKNDQLEDVPTY